MKTIKSTLQILSIIVDISGLLISLLSMDSFDNATFKYIIHLCQSFRTELLLLLIIILTTSFFIPFLYRHIKSCSRFNQVTCLTLLITAAIVAYPSIIGFVKARYYFFNNNILESHVQFAALEKGVKYLDAGEYDSAIAEFRLVDNFSNASKFRNAANSFSQEISKRINAANYIYSQFVIENINLEDRFHKLNICAKLDPNKYAYEHEVLGTHIRESITKYPELYKASNSKDYQSCRNLIMTYGDVWFEPIVKEKLLHDNEYYIMELLKQYLSKEDYATGQDRIRKKFFE